MDLGPPVAYLVLEEGVPVYGPDGAEVGAVEHVLATAEEDIFDGIVIDTSPGPGGWRFADAEQIEGLYEGGVRLRVGPDDCTNPARTLRCWRSDPAEVEEGPGRALGRSSSAPGIHLRQLLIVSLEARVLELVGDIQGLLDLVEFREGLIVALKRAMPADWVSLNDIGPDSDDYWTLVVPPLSQRVVEVFATLAHEEPAHPALRGRPRTGGPTACRTSAPVTSSTGLEARRERRSMDPSGSSTRSPWPCRRRRSACSGSALRAASARTSPTRSATSSTGRAPTSSSSTATRSSTPMAVGGCRSARAGSSRRCVARA